MMSNFIRGRGALAPFALALAAATFMTVGPSVTSFAQQDTTTKPAATTAAQAPKTRMHHTAAAREATSMRPQSVEQHIAALKTQLKITSAQESDWNAVAEAMRQNAKDMQDLITQTRAEGPRDQRNALQDLQNYQKFAEQHANGLQKVTSAFTTLYNAMTPEQKANADKVFRSLERRKPTGRG